MFVINSLIYLCSTFYLRFGIEGSPLNKGFVPDDIIFPEQDETLAYVPKCSNNRTFCEDVEIYPEQKFYKILKDSTYEQEYFSAQDEHEFSNRFHPDRENHICSSRTMTHHPRVARNSKNEWKFVYNFDKYKQQITTEECNSQTTCTRLQDFPRGVRTKCVQKYSDALLLVADENGKPVWDVFWFPSACICSYEHIMNTNFT